MADNAISVITSPNSFPVSVILDTYVILSPGFVQGLLGQGYFYNSSSQPLELDQFLEGEVMKEIGVGLDINNRTRVEAIKAQAVAALSNIEKATKGTPKEISDNNSAAQTYVQSNGVTLSGFKIIPFWIDSSNYLHVSIPSNAETILNGVPVIAPLIIFSNGVTVGQPTSINFATEAYVGPESDGYDDNILASVVGGIVQVEDDQGVSVASINVAGTLTSQMDSSGDIIGFVGPVLRFNNKKIGSIQFFGEPPGIDTRPLFTQNSEALQSGYEYLERNSMSGVLPVTFSSNYSFTDFHRHIFGAGFYQTGAAEIARELSDTNRSNDNDYLTILQQYYHPAPPILGAVTVVQSINGNPTTIYSASWLNPLTPTETPAAPGFELDGAVSNVSLSIMDLKNHVIRPTWTPTPVGTQPVTASALSPITVYAVFTEQMSGTFTASLTDGVTIIDFNPTESFGISQLAGGSIEEWYFVFDSSALAFLAHSSAVTLLINGHNASYPNYTLDIHPETVSFDGTEGTYDHPQDNTGLLFADSNHHFFLKGYDRTFVQAVTVSQYFTPITTATPIYEAAWPGVPPSTPTVTTDASGASVTLLATGPTIALSSLAQSGVGAHIDVHFNKPMNPAAVPSVNLLYFQVNNPSPVITQVVSGSYGPDNQTFSGETILNANGLSGTGQSVSIAISGAQDAQGQGMDTDPKTIAYQDGQGTWHGLETGADMYHNFAISTQTPTFTPTGAISPTPTCFPNWCYVGQAPSNDGNLTVAYHGEIYTFAAGGNPDPFNVWASSDGKNWPLLTNNPSFGYYDLLPYSKFVNNYWNIVLATCRGPAYVGLSNVAVSNDQLWAYDERYCPNVNFEVWNSSDGVNWNFRTATYSAIGAQGSLSGEGVSGSPFGLVIAGGYDRFDGFYSHTVRLISNSNITQYDATWPGRTSPIFYSFNGSLFMMGGYNPQVLKDIWETNDGRNWSQKATSMPETDDNTSQGSVFFTPPVEFNDGHQNAEWMLAGPYVNSGGDLNPQGLFVAPNIWYSTDGVSWGVVDPDPPDVGPLVVNNNKLFLIGTDGVWVYQNNGPPTVIPTPTSTPTFTPTFTFTPSPTFTRTFTNTKTDTFTSTPTSTPLRDTWNPVSPTPGLDPRESGPLVVQGGSLVLLGGHASFHNDLWYSNDGLTWTQGLDAGFSGRYGHTALTFDPATGLDDDNSSIWVLGGFDGASQNDVWSSPDANTWSEPVTHADFGARYYATGQVFAGKMWFMGGVNDAGTALNDVWSSSDGVQWTQAQTSNIWPARYRCTSFVANGKLWVVGGTNGTQYLNDVWCSSDGVTWTQVLAQAPFSPRAGLTSAVYNNVMYLIAGQVANGLLNDLWSSTDGFSWQISPQGTAFSPRTNHSTAVFNGVIWVVTGNTGNGFSNDVWYTPNLPLGPTPTPTSALVSCPAVTAWAGNGPNGIALDNQGRVLDVSAHFGQVCCSKGVTINVYDTLGNPVTQWDTSINNPKKMSSPQGLAVDPNGTMYITDNNISGVEVFNNQGQYLRRWGSFGTQPGQFEGPAGIAVNPTASLGAVTGLVYVADSNNQRIQVFGLDGTPVTQWGSFGSAGNGTFTTPWGLSLDASGKVYVADIGTGLVQVFNSAGTWIGQWGVTQGTLLQTAWGISVDAAGVVYVTDDAGEVGFFNSNGSPIGSTDPDAISFGHADWIAAGNPSIGAGQPGGWFVVDPSSGNIDAFNTCSLNGNPIGGTGGTATPTFTWTPTISPTPQAPSSPTHTPTNTPTLTATDSPTSSSTQTATFSPTDSMTPTLTNSSTSSPTDTPTATSTSSATDTGTNTPTLTPTATASYTPTDTPTVTVSPTPTVTSSATNTATGTYTNTATRTVTRTVTASMTATPSLTASATSSPTATSTATSSTTPIFTNTFTATLTATKTSTPTSTLSGTATKTATATNTSTFTVSSTPTKTGTPTASPTKTFTKTITPSPTKTLTPTFTKTFTATNTFTFTITPTPPLVCTGSLASPKLDLQVGCFQRDTQQERVHAKIINYDTVPVTIGNLSLKMWVNESKLVNMGQWVQVGTLCNAAGTTCVNVSNTGFSVSAGWLTGPCTVDSTHKANQVAVFTTNGSTQVIPAYGGYWDGGLDLGIGRNNSQMDDNWTDDYSKTTACPANLGEDSHFALYYNGTLLQEWTSSTVQDSQTGGAPCCGGGGAGPMVALGPMVAMAGGPTISGMVIPGRHETPTPTVGNGLLSSCGAVPNISRDGQPIQFQVGLNQAARIHLMILTISGEKVLETQSAGDQGMNDLGWDLRNGLGQEVASGLYLYYIQVDDGTEPQTKLGKLVILR